MTVNETLIVCKVLQENGYGEYAMMNEGGFNTLSEYVDWIDHEKKKIGMEGGWERYNDLLINQFIHEVLASNAITKEEPDAIRK